MQTQSGAVNPCRDRRVSSTEFTAAWNKSILDPVQALAIEIAVLTFPALVEICSNPLS